MTFPPSRDPSRRVRPQQPAGFSDEPTQRQHAYRPPPMPQGPSPLPPGPVPPGVQHPRHPASGAPRRSDASRPLLIVAAVVGLVAVVGAIAAAVSGSGSTDKGRSSGSSTSSSTTPFGCPLPDTSVEGGSDLWAGCTETSIAALPFCNTDISEIPPLRQVTPGTGTTEVLTQYRLNDGRLVYFRVYTNPTKMYAICGQRSVQLDEDDMRALSSPGGPEDLPAALR